MIIRNLIPGFASKPKKARRRPKSWTPSFEVLEERVCLAAPVAVDDYYNTIQDAMPSVPAAGVLSNDTDADGDPLVLAAAYVGSYPTANGSLTLNADGSFSYLPNISFTGTDIFTYKANDGTADSGVATVSLTVFGGPLTDIDPINITIKKTRFPKLLPTPVLGEEPPISPRQQYEFEFPELPHTPRSSLINGWTNHHTLMSEITRLYYESFEVGPYSSVLNLVTDELARVIREEIANGRTDDQIVTAVTSRFVNIDQIVALRLVTNARGALDETPSLAQADDHSLASEFSKRYYKSIEVGPYSIDRKLISAQLTQLIKRYYESMGVDTYSSDRNLISAQLTQLITEGIFAGKSDEEIITMVTSRFSYLDRLTVERWVENARRWLLGEGSEPDSKGPLEAAPDSAPDSSADTARPAAGESPAESSSPASDENVWWQGGRADAVTLPDSAAKDLLDTVFSKLSSEELTVLSYEGLDEVNKLHGDPAAAPSLDVVMADALVALSLADFRTSCQPHLAWGKESGQRKRDRWLRG